MFNNLFYIGRIFEIPANKWCWSDATHNIEFFIHFEFHIRIIKCFCGFCLFCNTALFPIKFLLQCNICREFWDQPIYSSLLIEFLTVADLRGAQGTGAHPGDRIFFYVMQFLRNFNKIVSWSPPPPRVGAPSSGKSWIRHCLKLFLLNSINSVNHNT